METKFKKGDRVLVRNLTEVYIVKGVDHLRSKADHPRYILDSEEDHSRRTEAYETDMRPASERAQEPELTLMPDDEPPEPQASEPEREPDLRAEEPPLLFGRSQHVRYVPAYLLRPEEVIYRGRFRAYENIRLEELPDGCPFEAVVTREINGHSVWVSVIDDGGDSFPCYLEEFYPTGPKGKTGAIELAVMLALGHIRPRRLPPST